MTPEGFRALQEELKHLKSVMRPKIISAIAEARAHGDLSENAEYDAAKEQQGFTEARIRDLEVKLSRCQVIDASKFEGEKVLFGATITLMEIESESQRTWTLVGEDEADLKSQKLSIASPIARALIGKSVGDEVRVKTPKGITEYQILTVSFQ